MYIYFFDVFDIFICEGRLLTPPEGVKFQEKIKKVHLLLRLLEK